MPFVSSSGSAGWPMAGIARQKGTGFYYAATHNFPDELYQHTTTVSHHRSRGSIIGRTLIDGKVIHVPDVLADPFYTQTITQSKGGYRTVLGVPLQRKGSPIGVIVLFRNTVRPFTPQQ